MTISSTAGRMTRGMCAAVFAATTSLGALTAVAQPASAAAPERCFQNNGRWNAKMGPFTAFTAIETLKWCGQNGRITKFWVLRCDTESRHRLVTVTRPSTCVPVGGLGGRSLAVDGSFWARSNNVPKVGSLNFEGHTHLTLYPDGRISGQVIMPK